jgi:hypothetical protein
MVKKMLFRSLVLLAAALPVFALCGAPAAQAVAVVPATSLDFDVAGIASVPGDMICWYGGTTALKGSGIEISQIAGNNGQILNVTGGLLSFNAGPNTGGWTFGSGGSIIITGDIGSGNETLLTGSFISAEIIPVTGTQFSIVLGGISNTNSADLTNYFQMPSGPFVGSLDVTTLAGLASPGSSFTCTTDLSGDVDDAPAPLPAAAWLFAPGLTGLIAMRRKLRA